MHIDWTCFALIVLEGEGSIEVLCYRPPSAKFDDPWVLPGGDKRSIDPLDDGVMRTLIGTVLAQTGIDISQASRREEIFSVTVQARKRNKKLSGRKKLTYTKRFYFVAITADRFIEQFQAQRGAKFIALSELVKRDLLLPEHLEIVKKYFEAELQPQES